MTNLKMNFTHTSLGLLIGICTTLSGCRFGNYSDPYLPLPQPPTYSVTDLYQTHARTLAAKVYTSSDINDDSITPTATSNPNAPLIAMPSEILSTFTSPVYYLVPVDTTLSPEFANLSLSSGLATGSIVNNAISYTENDPDTWYQFLNSPNCGIRTQVSHVGTVDTHATTYTDSDGSTYPIKGGLTLTMTYTQWFIGDCASDLNALATCYLNGSGCSSDTLTKANQTFDLYVRSGLIHLGSDDLSQIKGLEFTTEYDNN